MRIGIRGQLLAGISVLLLAAGGIAAVVVVHLVGSETEAQVLGEQRSRVHLVAAQLREHCAYATCGADLKEWMARRPLPQAIQHAILDERLSVMAGTLEQSTRTLSELSDALQGGQATWRRVQRPAEHSRGDGFDHHVAHPLDIKDGRRLVLVFTFSLDPLHDAIGEKQNLVLWYLLFDFFAVLLFGLYLSGRFLVRPIDELTRLAERIGPDQDGRAELRSVVGPVELERLSNAFIEMLSRLDQQRADLAQNIEALAATRDELVRSEKLATVGRLSAGVAHEVGNPLAAVMGYLDYIRDERELDPELKEQLLERMDTELKRIRETTRRLLDFSRPGETHMGPVNVLEVVDSTIELVKYQSAFTQIEISISGHCGPVHADSNRLGQVFVNLFLNAADAIRGEGQVEVLLSETNDRACILVSDSGTGLAQDAAEQIFEPFFTTKPQGVGTGLGLPISQRLINEMGGQLDLDEEGPLSGAGFRIELPLYATSMDSGTQDE